MRSAISPRVSRFAALALAVLIGWGMLSLAWGALAARLSIARQADEAREGYVQTRQRRVDVRQLKLQLAGLSSSDALRASAIESPNERSAIAHLRQAARAAVESANGKFLSATEYDAIKLPDTVAVQVRARASETDAPSIMRAIEQGDRPMRIDDLHLTGKMQKADVVNEVEIVAVLRVRWRRAGSPP